MCVYDFLLAFLIPLFPLFLSSGVFGNTTGLADATCSAACWSGGCSPTTNLCHEGYYCPSGSISGTQMQCGGAGIQTLYLFTSYINSLTCSVR